MMVIGFDTKDKKVSSIYLQSDFKGNERPATLQDALQLISVENPARCFARLYRNGVLQENYSEAECESIAEISNLLADLWQYTVKQDADGKDMRPYMNPLHLLCNSFMLIKSQQEIIKQYYEQYGPLTDS